MSTDFRLDGKTALVTGARTGIGQAIAAGLARFGADLVLLGRTGDLDETAELVRSEGREVETIALDLTQPEAIPEAISALLQRRRVDILVNNAGAIRRGPVEEIDYAGWREVMAVNLDAAFLLAQACGTAMARRGSGKIITVGSLLSFQGGVNVAAYAASKHALVGMTQALANEWAAAGVQVNAIAPGYIVTKQTRPLREDEDRNDAISARIPAGRWGDPEDMVGAAVFLAGPASAYVNGHTLVVDGGWMGR